MAKAIGTPKVSTRYQVTVPEEVRTKLKIRVGDILVFYEEANRIYVATEV